MLPTSSKKDLVGKNARSVTARIKCFSSSRRYSAARAAPTTAYWKAVRKLKREPTGFEAAIAR
jgi:hypothetical protein